MSREPNRAVISIIPARGGSKGIPRKNLVRIGGRPLIAYSIEHAMVAHRVSRVVVSTDDDEIAAVSERLGAEVVRRPDDLSGDNATSESALLHVLDHFRDTEQLEPDLVVFLQATSPLRRPTDIDAAIEQLLGEGADSLFSACAVHGFVWRQTEGELRSMSYDFRNRQRRQEIGRDLLENGSIYVFRPQVLRDTGNRLGGRITVFEMDQLDSFQIDEPADVPLIERLLTLRQQYAERIPDLLRVRLLVFDFDGVLTDDRVIVHQDGTEAVVCHRGDGLGLERLRHSGIPVVVVSKERNPVVAARCSKLGVEYLQGCDVKLPEVQRMASSRGLHADEIAYVGNDVNDLGCLEWVGVPIAVADAAPEVRAAAAWVTRCPGGSGAAREICEAILRQKAVRT